MNEIEIELSGMTMIILGALSSIAFIILTIWIAKIYNEKRKKERLKFKLETD